MTECDLKDISLSPGGKARIDWAWKSMPVLASVEKRFTKEKPLEGQRISACMHVTAETANLMRVLSAGGATVTLCASNPLSTQDDVAAAIVKEYDISVFAIKGEDNDLYYSHICKAIEFKPSLTMDDGADVVSTIHRNYPELADSIWGGTEETTTGVIRLKSMAKEKVLKYPIIAVNDAATKHLFDNRYGTGQSTIDGILRATNRILAGAIFVVGGYGMCGKGLALRARGMGAQVIVTEVDAIKALEAVMDGYQVMSMKEAAPLGDIFCTVTGNTTVISWEHFDLMKDGALVANAGHFNVELEVDALCKKATARRTIREHTEEFTLPNGKNIYVLGEGRLVNLAAAEGHPSSVMDMSFANQALSIEYIIKEYESLENTVYTVPGEIDRKIAALKLTSMGIHIDSLSPEQDKYLHSWQQGT